MTQREMRRLSTRCETLLGKRYDVRLHALQMILQDMDRLGEACEIFEADGILFWPSVGLLYSPDGTRGALYREDVQGAMLGLQNAFPEHVDYRGTHDLNSVRIEKIASLIEKIGRTM